MNGQRPGMDGVFFGGDRRRIPHLTNFTRMMRRVPERAKPRHHGQWGMDYHVEAAGDFSLDGRRWKPREARTAHLYAAGCAYWERSSPTDMPFPEMYLTFSIEDSHDLDPLVAAGMGFARFLDTEGLLAAAFARHVTYSEPEWPWQGQVTLYAILDLLLNSQPSTGADRLVTAGTAPEARRLTEYVEEHIRAHYHEQLSLEGIARAARVSVSTLTHRYRAETGYTPIGRLIEYRLDVARGMLIKGASLKAVAAHTGFYDEFHLSKAFKHRFGLPPRRYARQQGDGVFKER